jgi:hypothetical protein
MRTSLSVDHGRHPVDLCLLPRALFRFEPPATGGACPLPARRMDHDASDEHALSDLGSCTLDRSGTLWLGTSGLWRMLKCTTRDTARFHADARQEASARSWPRLPARCNGVHRPRHPPVSVNEFDHRPVAALPYSSTCNSRSVHELFAGRTLKSRAGKRDIFWCNDQGTYWTSYDPASDQLLRYDPSGPGRMTLIVPAMEAAFPMRNRCSPFPLLLGRDHSILWFGG